MSVRTILGVAAAMAVTGAAIAATNTKIKAFTAAGHGESCNPNVDGLAIFKDRIDPEYGARAELHLHVQDLQPGQTYNIAVYPSGESTPDAYNDLATFTTNASGNATIEVLMNPFWDLCLLGPNPRVQIFVNDPLGALDEVTPGELRAQGIAN